VPEGYCLHAYQETEPSEFTTPELLRAFTKLNTGKAYAEQVKPFNFLSFAPGARPSADENPAPKARGYPWSLADPKVKYMGQYVNSFIMDRDAFGGCKVTGWDGTGLARSG